MRTKLITIAAALSLLAFATAAQADLYGFTKITNNGNVDVASQLSVDVTANGSQVDFKFMNNVGIASSITDIYFDDGVLLGIASITDSGAGVAFSSPAAPPDLPGGNLAIPPFVTTPGFSADSDAPVVANGVNAASESVTIAFNLQGGNTFADIITALDSGALRIGLHVQGIGTTNGSDAYINDGVIPVPGAALLGLLGFGLIGWIKRRFA